jgi:hypothetical protein
MSIRELKAPKHLRKGQAMFCFLSWLATDKKLAVLDITMTSSDKRGESHFQLGDPFYIADDKLEAFWDEWVSSLKEKANESGTV